MKTSVKATWLMVGLVLAGTASGWAQEAPKEKQPADSDVQEIVRKSLKSEAADRPLLKDLFESSGKLFVSKNFSRSEEKIDSQLDSISPVEFHGIPLANALQYLSQQHGIPIRVDSQALEEESLTGEEEISLTVSGVSFRDVLKLILEEVEGVPLTTIIEDGVLKVTTQIVADTKLVTWVYDVRPLNIADPNELLKVVQAGTNGLWGDEWVLVNGNPQIKVDKKRGQITFLNGSLIVRHTQAVHEEVEELLNNLAQQFKLSPDYHGPASASGGMNPQPTGGMGGVGGGYF